MKKIIVYHSYYGCDTGCCGHSIMIDDRRVKFDFGHPSSKEDVIEWAKALLIKEVGEEHLKDVDWDKCEIVSFNKCDF